MILHVTRAEFLSEYKISLDFNDGRSGIADLEGALDGGVFEELKQPHLFSQLKLDHELSTVCWPNGVDLAPEFLYFKSFQNDSNLQDKFQAWGYMEG